MNEELEALQAVLRKGLQASMQGSYQRRLPDKAALPYIRRALDGLRKLVRANPSAEAWRSLALAEEAMLHYPSAVRALKTALSLSEKPDRKDLKRLAQLQEYAVQWERLGLSAEKLEALGRHLEKRLRSEPCDHTLSHTEAWLSTNGVKSKAKVIRALGRMGGYCDCEVLANAV